MPTEDVSELVACPDCGALYRRAAVVPGQKARCRRCGRVLYRGARLNAERLLALIAAALIVLVIANSAPIVDLRVQGIGNAATLTGSILALWADGRWLVAALVAATTLVFPLLDLLALGAALLLLRRNPASALAAWLLRLLRTVRPWGMVEVFMLGVLVALVKLSHMAEIHPGVALWAFAALTVLFAAILSYDLRGLWEARPVAPRAPLPAEAALVPCPVCGLVGPPAPHCPRCGAAVPARKHASLPRTWAFLLAGAILYVPANVLPIMRTSAIGGAESDTIMSGIVYFWTSGSPDLAVLIFFVSIFIPMAKIGSLTMLLLTVRRGSPRGKRRRTVLYRIVEFVGRWSMLDVFVVALMVGLVRFGALAAIDAGPGAAAFGAVVVLTMLAAHEFDPRLLWDTEDTHD